MRRFARIAANIGKGVLAALLALLLIYDGYILIAKASGVRAPTVFGFATAAVATGSMAPAIDAGDLIVTRAQDGYAVGDIVTYLAADGTSTTHRIVAKSGGTYTTKGDANNAADPAVGESAIVGKVVCALPGLGAAVTFLQSPAGLCIAAAAGIGLWLLIDLLSGRVKREKVKE